MKVSKSMSWVVIWMYLLSNILIVIGVFVVFGLGVALIVLGVLALFLVFLVILGIGYERVEEEKKKRRRKNGHEYKETRDVDTRL